MRTWAPRESVAARLVFDADPHPGIAGPASEGDFSCRFGPALCREASDALAQLAGDLRALGLPGLDQVDVDLEADDWRLAGAAVLLPDGSSRLTLSMGFILAVEEATLEFLAHGDALCPRSMFSGEDEDARPIEVLSYDFDAEARPGRLYDYRAARSDPAPEAVTGRFPVDLWRLRQQELLATLVVRWAALHEIAHAALRHNEVLAELYGRETAFAGMVEVEPAAATTSDFDWRKFGYERAPEVSFDIQPVRKVLELHADTAALWLCLDLARHEDECGEGPFSAFERDMAELAGDNPFVFAELSPDTRTHFILLAALIAIILFERARRATGMEEGHSHPIPEARLITLLHAGFYGCQSAQADGEGGFEIRTPESDYFGEGPTSPWNRFVLDAVARAIEDMTFFAAVIDLDIELFDQECGPPELEIDFAPDGYPRPIRDIDPAPTAAWWRDVLAWNRTALAGRHGQEYFEPGVSRGGREIDALGPYQPHLNFLTEVFQHLHGEPLQFLLNVRAASSS